MDVYIHMVECEELGRAMKIDGERDIEAYLATRFVDQCMFSWHNVIKELATSSMSSTIDRLDILWSFLDFILSMQWEFLYMSDYPLWYLGLLITNMMMSLHVSLDLDLWVRQMCGLMTYLIAVGWLKCGLSISMRLF